MSPDMILTPFDGKFDETKDEIPPGACEPPNKLNNKWVKVDHQKVEKTTMSKKWSKKVEKKQCRKGGFIYSYRPLYTFMDLYILTNSFIYLHIPPHTSKY